jgi:hypothetical protein
VSNYFEKISIRIKVCRESTKADVLRHQKRAQWIGIRKEAV